MFFELNCALLYHYYDFWKLCRLKSSLRLQIWRMVGISHICTVKMCALQWNECSSLSIRLFFLPLFFSRRATCTIECTDQSKCHQQVYARIEFWNCFWKRNFYFNGYIAIPYDCFWICVIIFEPAVSREGDCRKFFFYIRK